MEFGAGWQAVLMTVLLLAVALGAVAFGQRRRRRVLATLVGPRFTPVLTATVHQSRRRVRDLLLILAVLLLGGALARPRWGGQAELGPHRSRDVVLVLDCSRSMLAQDAEPSRLEQAKTWAARLIRECAGDRFGLVAFARHGFLECPLTHDQAAVLRCLDDLGPESLPVGGSDLEAALRTGYETFRASHGGQRALVLLSDGEALQGDLARVLPGLAEARLPVLAVGFGDPGAGALIQLDDGTVVKDAGGEPVRSRLNEVNLRGIAAATGGFYLRSSAVAVSVATLRRQLDTLVPGAASAGGGVQPSEHFQIPLLLACVCLLARLLLGEKRPLAPSLRAAATAGLAGLLLLVYCNRASAAAGAPLTSIAHASAPSQRAALERERAALEGALQPAPRRRRARFWYNLGLAQAALGERDLALVAFRHAVDTGYNDPEARVRALQNIGVLAHREAREAMATDPVAALRRLRLAADMYRHARALCGPDPLLRRNQGLLAADERVAAAAVRARVQAAGEKSAESAAPQGTPPRLQRQAAPAAAMRAGGGAAETGADATAVAGAAPIDPERSITDRAEALELLRVMGAWEQDLRRAWRLRRVRGFAEIEPERNW